MSIINSQKFERELKKGGAELLVLFLLEARRPPWLRTPEVDRDALGRRAEVQRRLALSPAIPAGKARLDRRPAGGKAGERRRRFYNLTKDGKKALAAQRGIWESFVAAINPVTRPENA